MYIENRSIFKMVVISVLLGFIAITSCRPDKEVEETGEPEIHQPDSREVVIQFIDAYNNRDIIALKAVFSDPVKLNGNEYDPDSFIKNSWAERLWESFPDARINPTHLASCDDYVMLRTEGEMTGKGKYLGFDVDGKTIKLSEMSLFQIQNGQIVEWWYENDMLGFWEQLGLVENPIARK